MRFALKAIDTSSQIVAVELDAIDESAARQQAKQRGYYVLSVRKRSFGWQLNKAPFPTTLFSIELLALLDAGLNVVEALQGLAEKESRPEHQRIMDGLLAAIRQGESLSQAVGRFPDAFSALYAATIRSTERTGDLKEALRRFVAYEEELDRVRKKLVAALIYPAILIVAGTLVLAFLLLYVVPRFARVYEDINTQLPFFSALLLWVGRWIEQNGMLTGLLLVTLAAGGLYALSRPRIRVELITRLWHVPAIGERMRVYQLARLYRTVGMLLRAGIPAVKALEMVPGLLSAELQPRLERAKKLIEEGRPMSTAFTSTDLTTPVAARMMAVGERSGEMGELLDRAARFCDDDTARFVDRSTRIFEPALMALLGLAVGGVVVLMYMPIFELAGSVR